MNPEQRQRGNRAQQIANGINVSLHDYKREAFLKEERKFVNGYGWPAGHVKVDTNGKTINSAASKVRKYQAQLIASSIVIPNESCVLNFEVSGEFDIGILEEKKRREPATAKDVIGMKFPSFKQKSGGKVQKTTFFNPKTKKLSDGPHKLQMIIDREEGTLSFTVDGTKSQRSIHVEHLLQQNAWDHFRYVSVYVVMRTNATAQVTFQKISQPENERINYLFAGKNCSSCYGNLPYGMFREISEFI